jgi:hypothetical protein
MHVAVEKSGGETATARIAQILNDTAGCKLAFQHRGEQLADKAVIPTIGRWRFGLGNHWLGGGCGGTQQ